MPSNKVDLKQVETTARSLGSVVRAKREEMGYSIYRVQQVAGVDYNTIKMFELGAVISDLRSFIAICWALELKPSEVMQEVADVGLYA